MHYLSGLNAPNVVDYVRTEESKALEKVATPGKQTIEEVSAFLGVEAKDTCKAGPRVRCAMLQPMPGPVWKSIAAWMKWSVPVITN